MKLDVDVHSSLSNAKARPHFCDEGECGPAFFKVARCFQASLLTRFTSIHELVSLVHSIRSFKHPILSTSHREDATPTSLPCPFDAFVSVVKVPTPQHLQATATPASVAHVVALHCARDAMFCPEHSI